jgi:hypothetical protein
MRDCRGSPARAYASPCSLVRSAGCLSSSRGSGAQSQARSAPASTREYDGGSSPEKPSGRSDPTPTHHLAPGGPVKRKTPTVPDFWGELDLLFSRSSKPRALRAAQRSAWVPPQRRTPPTDWPARRRPLGNLRGQRAHALRPARPGAVTLCKPQVVGERDRRADRWHGLQSPEGVRTKSPRSCPRCPARQRSSTTRSRTDL